MIDALTQHSLVGGTVLFSAAVILFVVMRREDQVRPDASWSNVDFVYLLVAPVMTIALALGAGFMFAGVNALPNAPVTGGGWAIIMASAAVAAVTWGMLSRAPSSEETARKASATAA